MAWPGDTRTEKHVITYLQFPNSLKQSGEKRQLAAQAASPQRIFEGEVSVIRNSVLPVEGWVPPRRLTARALASSMLALWSILATTRAGGQCQYDLTVIPTPPCQFTLTIRAFGVSDAGHVVGLHEGCSNFEDVAYIWTAETGMIDVPFPPGTTDAEAYDVNSCGLVVGQADLPGDGNDELAFIYHDGTVTMLGTLPGGTKSEAVAVNELGQVTGTAVDVFGSALPATPFLWENGEMTALELPLGPNGAATDINNAGQIVGWMGGAPGTSSYAFVWEAGVATDIGLPPSAFAASASAINKSGKGRAIH